MGTAALDLTTKRIAESALDEPVALLPGLRLELGHNAGVAFGALTGVPSWILVLVISGLLVALVFATWRGALPLPWPVGGLLLGGAIANLIDRVGDGRVTDFIDAARWPAFNLADVAITAGVLALLWASARGDERPQAAGLGER